MKIKDNFFILFFTFLLLGVLVTIQIRSTVSQQRESASTLDMEKMQSQLDSKIKLGEQYKLQITELENKKEAFLQSTSVSVTNVKAQEELEYMKLISGLTDVTGDGIVITLNDAENVNPDEALYYVIHDSDVYDVINQLRIAGAQAICINNERIIATSEQLCAGPTIKINNNRYAVPFEIKAIGDADVLYDQLNNSEIINNLIISKKRVTITKEENIIVPKFMNDINSLISRLEVYNNESKKNK